MSIPTDHKPPWDEINDGRAYKLLGGIDFMIPRTKLQKLAHPYASYHGMQVRTERFSLGLWIQFRMPDEPWSQEIAPMIRCGECTFHESGTPSGHTLHTAGHHG